MLEGVNTVKASNPFTEREREEAEDLEKNQIELWKKLTKNRPRIVRKAKLEKMIKKRIKDNKNINRRLRLWTTTLDVDTTDKEIIKRIWQKIIKCPNNRQLEICPSSLKGFHFIVRCRIDCMICRFVYDDFRRFAYDSNRPYYARNILFQQKGRLKLLNSVCSKNRKETRPKDDIEIKS